MIPGAAAEGSGRPAPPQAMPRGAVRRAASLGVVLGGLVIAIPFMAGVLAWRAHDAALQSLVQDSEGRLVVETTGYSIGWLTSRATVWIGPSSAPGVRLRIEQTIAHGPLPWLGWRAGATRPALALVRSEGWPEIDGDAPLARALGARPLLHATTRIALDRSARLELQSPAFAAEGLEWGGASGSATFAEQASSGRLCAPLLAGRQGEVSVRVQDLCARFDVHVTRAGVPLGQWSASLAGLDIESPDAGTAPGRLVLQGFEIAQQIDERPQDLVDVVLRIGAERAQVGNEPIAHPRLEVTARNLDLVVLSVLRARLRESASGDEVEATPVEVLMEDLPALLERDPSLELTRLHASTATGELDWSGRLWIEGLDPEHADPLAVLAALRAEARLLTPLPIFQSFVDRQVVAALRLPDGGTAPAVRPRVVAVRSGLLERWLKMGRIAQEGDAYVARLTLERGTLTAGGQPLAPAAIALEIQQVAAEQSAHPARPLD